MPRRYGQACPVAKSLEVLGERWTLLIVRDLLRGPARFQDLQTSLDGIAPNLLSERLKLMEEHGLIERRLYSERPPRAEYHLSDKGRELGVVVGALAQWGTRHLHHEHRLVNDECGHPVKLVYYCPTCDARVRGVGVRLKRKRKLAKHPTDRARPPPRKVRRRSSPLQHSERLAWELVVGAGGARGPRARHHGEPSSPLSLRARRASHRRFNCSRPSPPGGWGAEASRARSDVRRPASHAGAPAAHAPRPRRPRAPRATATPPRSRSACRGLGGAEARGRSTHPAARARRLRASRLR